MFRWYRDAERCYVYMADVSHASASNEQEIAPWRTPFQNSRWFSRGWTLQELIAPKVVEFYSKEGTFLGDKQSLEYIIRDITGIPTKALRGTPLSEFTVTERESWARNRQTKYEEDMAYSLLAIFSIFLPLIYGEGRDEANGDFEKRKEELAEMRRTLISDGSRRVVVLHGLGGIGKTQLAVAYLKRYRDEYSAIFWLNMKDETSIRQSFVNVTKQIQQQGADAHLFSELGADDDPNKAVEAAKLWLSLPGNTRWLLVYDNYDAAKLTDLYLSQEKLQEAEALCLKVVRGYEETLGRDIITTAFALLQLGSVYLAQRRFEEAKKIYLEILKKPMRKPGLEPHLAMFAALDLGWLYHIRGRFRGAESMFRRALGGFEVWLGPNHRQTLVLVSRLGHLCMEQDRADKAEPLLARALHGYEETIGPAGFAQSREALEAVADMGMLRLSQDQQREARGYLRRAHDGYMSLLGPDHARTRQPQTVLRELEWLSVFD
ncbi:hypothetical protein MY5147_001245 [Beauveria neobassiana]